MTKDITTVEMVTSLSANDTVYCEVSGVFKRITLANLKESLNKI